MMRMKSNTKKARKHRFAALLLALSLLAPLINSIKATEVAESPSPGNGLGNVDFATRAEIFRVKDEKTAIVNDQKILDRIKRNMTSFVLGDEGDPKAAKEIYVVRFFNSQNVEVSSVKVLAYNWIWIEGDKNPRHINVGRVDLSTLQQAF